MPDTIISVEENLDNHALYEIVNKGLPGTLFGCYMTKGLSIISGDHLNDLADNLLPDIRINANFLRDELGENLDHQRPWNQRDASVKGIIECLQIMKKRPLCRGTWCVDPLGHWRKCFTVGGLIDFLLKNNRKAALDLVKCMDKQPHAQVICRPSYFMKNIWAYIKDLFWRSRHSTDTEVMFDLNSLEMEEIRPLLKLVYSIKNITPYIIPTFPIDERERRQRWRNFVSRQLAALSERSVVVIGSVDVPSDLLLDPNEMEVEDVNGARLFVRACADQAGRSVFSADEIRNPPTVEMEEIDDAEIDEADEDGRFQLQAVDPNLLPIFVGRLALTLLRCPYQ